MAWIKHLVRAVTDEFWIGSLFSQGPIYPDSGVAEGMFKVVTNDEIMGCQFPEIASLAWSPEPDRYGFGAWVDGRLVAVCWYQARDSFRNHGGFLPLRDDEAELAQITTADQYRGRGLAVGLIRFSALSMRDKGFRRLFAKVWLRNTPSEQAFRRAGWKFEKKFVFARFRVIKKTVLVRFSL